MQLWIFGKAKGMPELQNDMIDRLHNCLGRLLLHKLAILNADDIVFVYSNTMPDAMLRKMIVELGACHGVINQGFHLYPVGFVRDLVDRLMGIRDHGLPQSLRDHAGWMSSGPGLWHVRPLRDQSGANLASN